jgi:hypothetical protein
VVLVVGAGLLLRSYENVRSVDLGFDPEGVYTVAQALPLQPGSAYADQAGDHASRRRARGDAHPN